MLQSDGTILRYKLIQRVGHWVNVVAFLTLAITGAFLFFWPLAPLASVWSRLVHRIGAILLVLGPLFYFVADRRDFMNLLRASFTYDRTDLKWFIQAPFYFLGLAKNSPPQGQINAGQRVHHALTIICYNLVAWSGFLMWLGAGRISAQWFLGALVVHDISMAVLIVLMIGHMYFSFVYGALDGMLKGTISRVYAQVEHPLWLQELERQASHTGKDLKR